MAKPTLKSEKVMDAICEQLAKGIPLAVICREDKMPAARTVRDWLKSDADFLDRVQAARDDGEEVILANCLEIADTPDEGVVERWEPVKVTDPAKPDEPAREELRLVERRVEDRLHHRKLRIWTRFELLKRWNPRKYGDRVQHANDPTDPMPAPQWIVQPVAPAPTRDDDV